MNLKKTLILGNIILLIGATIWAVNDNSMEPKLAVGTLFLALIAQIWNINRSSNVNESPSMKQKAGKNSKQYQAGGDIKIGEK